MTIFPVFWSSKNHLKYVFIDGRVLFRATFTSYTPFLNFDKRIDLGSEIKVANIRCLTLFA